MRQRQSRGPYSSPFKKQTNMNGSTSQPDGHQTPPVSTFRAGCDWESLGAGQVSFACLCSGCLAYRGLPFGRKKHVISFPRLIPHSLQPSFFSKTSCFPWGSDGFLERRIPGKKGEVSPRVFYWLTDGAKPAKSRMWVKMWVVDLGIPPFRVWELQHSQINIGHGALSNAPPPLPFV